MNLVKKPRRNPITKHKKYNPERIFGVISGGIPEEFLEGLSASWRQSEMKVQEEEIPREIPGGILRGTPKETS